MNRPIFGGVRFLLGALRPLCHFSHFHWWGGGILKKVYNVMVWVIVCYVGFMVCGKIFFLQKLRRGTLWVSFLVGEGVLKGACFRAGRESSFHSVI